MYDVIVEESAAFEIEEIYFWYEGASVGLGDKFKEDLQSRIKILYRNPYAFSFKTSEHRAAPLKKFPYLIIYKIIEKTVIVLSVLYGGRDLENLQTEW